MDKPALPIAIIKTMVYIVTTFYVLYNSVKHIRIVGQRYNCALLVIYDIIVVFMLSTHAAFDYISNDEYNKGVIDLLLRASPKLYFITINSKLMDYILNSLISRFISASKEKYKTIRKFIKIF